MPLLSARLPSDVHGPVDDGPTDTLSVEAIAWFVVMSFCVGWVIDSWVAAVCSTPAPVLSTAQQRVAVGHEIELIAVVPSMLTADPHVAPFHSAALPDAPTAQQRVVDGHEM